MAKIAGKWWLMVLLGLVVGLGAGLPLGGHFFGSKAADEPVLGAIGPMNQEYSLTVAVGQEFPCTIVGTYSLKSYDGSYVALTGTEDSSGFSGFVPVATYKFKALKSTGGKTTDITWNLYGWSGTWVYHVTIN